MRSMNLTDVPEHVFRALRERAAANGRTPTEEALFLLEQALADEVLFHSLLQEVDGVARRHLPVLPLGRNRSRIPLRDFKRIARSLGEDP